MTKTYNDIEAVTRLLEEKERDLEIAARIGQSLLDKNRDLQLRNDQLEDDVQSTADKVSQLRHELGMKDALLSIYTKDEAVTPDSPDLCYGVGLHNMDGLRRRLNDLEEENLALRSESNQLLQATDDLEEKETKLVDDCVQRLSMANDQVKTLTEDNMKKTECYYKQQEEITNLLAKVVTLEAKVKKMTAENAELQAHLQAAQMSQKSLTLEISELKDKYEECVGLLHESNEEIKALRNRQRPRPVRQYSYTPFLPHDSLASELESSLRGHSPEIQKKHRAANSRVLETARLARRHARPKRVENLPGSNMSGSDCDTAESSHRNSIYISDTDAESLPDDSMGSGPLGKLGVPGSNDLETALRRLSARREQDGYTRHYPDSHDHGTGTGTTDTEVGSVFSNGGDSTPTPCWSPDSFMSTGSGISGGGSSFKFPEKLQIIKPLEGSATLHQWQRLARPDITAVLDDRPGVMIKGERKLEVDCDVDSYTLSDFEEDDDYQYYPRRAAESTSMTYTYTTATVLHPSDDYCTTTLTSTYESTPRPSIISLTTDTQVTMSTSGSRVATVTVPTLTGTPPVATPSASVGGSKLGTPLTASTPITAQSRGTSTFSVSLGLAQTLRERGFLAEKFDTNRVSSIVTETMYDNTRSNVSTPTIYTTPSANHTQVTTTSIYTAPTELASSTAIPSFSINARDDWMKAMDKLVPRDQEFAFNLTEKIKNIGLDNLLKESRKKRPDNLELSSVLPTSTPPNSPTKREPPTPPSSPSDPTPGSPGTPPNSPTASGAALSSPFSFKSRPMSQLSGQSGQKSLCLTGLAMAAGPSVGVVGRASTITRAQRELMKKHKTDS